MKKYKDIALIRAGFLAKQKIAHPMHIPPPLSLKYTKALLESIKHARVDIIDCLISPCSKQDLVRRLDKSGVELIVIEVSPATFEQGYDLCKTLKEQSDVLIIAVGPDVTERYEYYLSLNSVFDASIRGEFELQASSLLEVLIQSGEKAMLEKLRQVDAATKASVVDQLEDLPSLQWSKEELKTYPYSYPLRLHRRILPGYVSTSRGCRHGCTFCSPSVRKSYGKKFRPRRISAVADEMEYLQGLGVNYISFEDDDLTGSEEHVLSLCAEIRRRGLNLKWGCHARIDEVSLGLLEAMKGAGCILILFGIESGSKRIINLLHKVPSKTDWNMCAKQVFADTRRVGIAACAMFLVGNPTETDADIEESMTLSYELKPEFIKVHNFTLYPGSRDYKTYYKEINGQQLTHHYMEPLFNVSQLDDAALKKAQLRFYRKFLFRPQYFIWHVYRYFIYYLLNFNWSFSLLTKVCRYLMSNDNKESSLENDS